MRKHIHKLLSIQFKGFSPGEKPVSNVAGLPTNQFDPQQSTSVTANQNLVSKMQALEQEQKNFDKSFDSRQYIKNLFVPVALVTGSVVTYYLWSTRPFAIVHKHLSLGEHTVQKHCWHTLSTSALSFKNSGQIATYLPAMTLSLLVLARKLRTRHFAATFMLNSIICGFVTILYEKNYSLSRDKLMIPKIGGCYTALMYMSLLATLFPNLGLFGTRLLPFWAVPVMFTFYEYHELKDAVVHEISRPSHLVALGNGVIFGLILRRFGNLLQL